MNRRRFMRGPLALGATGWFMVYGRRTVATSLAQSAWFLNTLPNDFQPPCLH